MTGLLAGLSEVGISVGPRNVSSPERPGIFTSPHNLIRYRGRTVVKALCYKSEGRWFDPSWCHWNFSLT